MVSSFSLAILLASTLLVRAQVTPNTPITGKAGSTCSISWSGDSNSTSNWSNMAIELMTGDNFNMVFLTTVTTGQDGTKDGSFTWTCPQVTPYSAIYFYQFISPTESSDPQWTTRFAIASSSGTTTTPTNTTQPNGDQIAWGTGALVDASSASAAPAFASGATSGSVPATSALPSSALPSSSASGSGSLTTPKTSTTATSIVGGGNTKGAAGASTTPVSAGTGTDSNNAAATSASNAGLGLAVDARVWTTAFGVVSSAMGLALFL